MACADAPLPMASRSRMVTLTPSRARYQATEQPTTPAPMTTTSVLSGKTSLSNGGFCDFRRGPLWCQSEPTIRQRAVSTGRAWFSTSGQQLTDPAGFLVPIEPRVSLFLGNDGSRCGKLPDIVGRLTIRVGMLAYYSVTISKQCKGPKPSFPRKREPRGSSRCLFCCARNRRF